MYSFTLIYLMFPCDEWQLIQIYSFMSVSTSRLSPISEFEQVAKYSIMSVFVDFRKLRAMVYCIKHIHVCIMTKYRCR